MRTESSGPGWATAAIVAGGIVALTSFSQSASAATLSYQSIDTPSLAVFNGNLFMAYAGNDSNHRLNYAVTSDGVNWSQVTDGSNRSGGGPAIAVFNGKMFVAFPGINDHEINIASSTDGQHFSNQYVINSNWFTPWRPALGSGGGKLWLAFQGQDNGLYTAYTTDGSNWTFGPIRHAQSGTILGINWSSQVAWPPTLAPSSADGSAAPNIVYTWSQSQQELGIAKPNNWQITLQSVTSVATAAGVTCRVYPTTTGAGPQGGLGYLSGVVLMPWIASGQIALDVNRGSCVTSGITYPSSTSPASGGSYGSTGVAPAAVGWNGHAYIAYTGNDSGQHINFLEIF
jgi:hypothetical protein